MSQDRKQLSEIIDAMNTTIGKLTISNTDEYNQAVKNILESSNSNIYNTGKGNQLIIEINNKIDIKFPIRKDDYFQGSTNKTSIESTNKNIQLKSNLINLFLFIGEAVKNLFEGLKKEGGSDITSGVLKVNSKDIINLTEGMKSTKTLNSVIKDIRTSYGKISNVNSNVLNQWIKILDDKIPNGLLLYRIISKLNYGYWIKKNNKEIKKIEDKREKLIDYTSEVFR